MNSPRASSRPSAGLRRPTVDLRRITLDADDVSRERIGKSAVAVSGSIGPTHDLDGGISCAAARGTNRFASSRGAVVDRNIVLTRTLIHWKRTTYDLGDQTVLTEKYRKP